MFSASEADLTHAEIQVAGWDLSKMSADAPPPVLLDDMEIRSVGGVQCHSSVLNSICGWSSLCALARSGTCGYQPLLCSAGEFYWRRCWLLPRRARRKHCHRQIALIISERLEHANGKSDLVLCGGTGASSASHSCAFTPWGTLTGTFILMSSPTSFYLTRTLAQEVKPADRLGRRA